MLRPKFVSHPHKNGVAILQTGWGHPRREKREEDSGRGPKGTEPESLRGEAGHVQEDKELRGSCLKRVDMPGSRERFGERRAELSLGCLSVESWMTWRGAVSGRDGSWLSE